MTSFFSKLSSTSRRKDAGPSAPAAQELENTSMTSVPSERSSQRSRHVVISITANEAHVRMIMCPKLESDPVPASFKKSSHPARHSHHSHSSLSSDSMNGSLFQVVSKSHSCHPPRSHLISHSSVLTTPFATTSAHILAESTNDARVAQRSTSATVLQPRHMMQEDLTRAEVDEDSTDEDCNSTQSTSYASSLDSIRSCAAISATRSNNRWNLPWQQHIVHMCPYCNRPVRPESSVTTPLREKRLHHNRRLGTESRSGSISRSPHKFSAAKSSDDVNRPDEVKCCSNLEPVNPHMGDRAEGCKAENARCCSTEASNDYSFGGITINLHNTEEKHASTPFPTSQCHAYCRCQLSKKKSCPGANSSSLSLRATKALSLDTTDGKESTTSNTKGANVARTVSDSTFLHKHAHPQSHPHDGGHGHHDRSYVTDVKGTNSKSATSDTAATCTKCIETAPKVNSNYVSRILPSREKIASSTRAL